ncbi:MAG: heparan-alpha-glucosaminide N-acetyltransferase domain-containing protein, partial [Bacteroidota bacterium]
GVQTCAFDLRDYLYYGAFMTDPTNLETASGWLFFTRIITHYCAPVFVFLAGTAAFLFGQKQESPGQLRRFLISRGIWLIILDITINTFFWSFDIQMTWINFQVLWAIGFSMICLAALSYLPLRFILGAGLLLVFGHDLLNGIRMDGQGFLDVVWYLLHQNWLIFVNDGARAITFSYPVLPWIGVMALGYGLGYLYQSGFPQSERKKRLIQIGGAAVMLFFLIRGINVYGDPAPWEFQATIGQTIMSFFKVSKYPPSLQYLLMTLGPALLFLAFSEKWKNSLTDKLLIFGRVPLFYYLLHVLVIHGIAIILLAIQGKDISPMILDGPSILNANAYDGYGYNLGIVYLIWISVVVALYPVCKWYQGYKARNRDKLWLKYL